MLEKLYIKKRFLVTIILNLCQYLNIINHLKENTSKIISEKGYDNVDFVVEYSRSGFGDITCNVAFLLAKNLKKNPQEIAQEFAVEYNLGNDLEKVEAHKSGYLNFFINNNSFNNEVLPQSLKENYEIYKSV